MKVAAIGPAVAIVVLAWIGIELSRPDDETYMPTVPEEGTTVPIDPMFPSTATPSQP